MFVGMFSGHTRSRGNDDNDLVLLENLGFSEEIIDNMSFVESYPDDPIWIGLNCEEENCNRIASDIASFPDGLEILQEPGLDNDEFDNIVFGAGLGFYWIREWLGMGKYGAPSIHPSYYSKATRYFDHPAVRESAVRKIAEEVATNEMRIRDVPREWRHQVYEIAVLYGCQAEDLLELVSTLKYEDGGYEVTSRSMLEIEGSVIPLPPREYSADSVVRVVPSLRDMCRSFFPCGVERETAMDLPVGRVVYPDLGAKKYLASKGGHALIDADGVVAMRGSMGAALQGRGRLHDDVDVGVRVRLRDWRMGKARYMTRDQRILTWLHFLGVERKYKVDGTHVAYLHPMMLTHPGLMSIVFTRVKSFMLLNGITNVKLKFPPTRVVPLVIAPEVADFAIRRGGNRADLERYVITHTFNSGLVRDYGKRNRFPVDYGAWCNPYVSVNNGVPSLIYRKDKLKDGEKETADYVTRGIDEFRPLGTHKTDASPIRVHGVYPGKWNWKYSFVEPVAIPLKNDEFVRGEHYAFDDVAYYTAKGPRRVANKYKLKFKREIDQYRD